MNKETGYMHMPIGNGFVTVAIRAEKRWPSVRSRKCEIGLAFCSPRDQFSRKKGRLIAEGRLDKHGGITIPLVEGERVKKQVRNYVIKQIVLGSWGPQWVYRSSTPVVKQAA
jgi:hypothetical protein